MIRIVLVLVLLFQCTALAAQGRPDLRLPLSIDPSNTSVHFAVDSTWHLVEGRVHKMRGTLWQEDQKDPLALQAEIHFPVATFDTENHSRDKKIREIFAEAAHHDVVFKLDRLASGCPPLKTALSEQGCAGILKGSLTIKEVTKDVDVPYYVKRGADGNYEISGKVILAWKTYGIEDPSMFLSKVNPVVTVTYSLSIPTEQTSVEQAKVRH